MKALWNPNEKKNKTKSTRVSCERESQENIIKYFRIICFFLLHVLFVKYFFGRFMFFCSFVGKISFFLCTIWLLDRNHLCVVCCLMYICIFFPFWIDGWMKELLPVIGVLIYSHFMFFALMVSLFVAHARSASKKSIQS